jgi:hypothetical protein
VNFYTLKMWVKHNLKHRWQESIDWEEACGCDYCLNEGEMNIDPNYKTWWAGDPRVEAYMKPVREALERRGVVGESSTDIYNRAYEAVYKAIKDRDEAVCIERPQ